MIGDTGRFWYIIFVEMGSPPTLFRCLGGLYGIFIPYRRYRAHYFEPPGYVHFICLKKALCQIPYSTTTGNLKSDAGFVCQLPLKIKSQ